LTAGSVSHWSVTPLAGDGVPARSLYVKGYRFISQNMNNVIMNR
jgi:hypothetical protein